MVDCCKHSKRDKKCRRKKDKKSFNLPRKFSKKKCKNPKGFTMKSSCAPYKECRSRRKKNKSRKIKKGGKKELKAYFAGGCFWGIEEKFSKLKGIVNTQVGYMGGNVDGPTYEMVSSGKTGHSETVMIKYNPKIIPYTELLENFFKFHDPTSFDKQGADIGPQYRAIVFYDSSKQKNDYQTFIKKYRETNHIKLDSIKTKLLKKKKFYLAEDYHQKYNFQKECSSLNTENKEVFKKICKNNTKLAEKPGSGKYYSEEYRNGEIKGIYHCSCCNSLLYLSQYAYDSGTGWPAFSQPFKNNSILFNEKTSELRCRGCGLHLGHRTFDGPTKTKLHDCINSTCLHFIEKHNRKRSKRRGEKKKTHRKKKSTKGASVKPKNLTKLGEEWVDAASKDMKQRELLYLKKGGSKKKRSKKKRSKKKQFLYHPDNPKKSFDVYIDKDPSDTIPIKYTDINDVKDTIKKLENLYKKGKYPHKRIWQVGMIMYVRLKVLKKKKEKEFKLSEKYFQFLGKRTKIKGEKERKKLKFKVLHYKRSKKSKREN